MFEGYVRGLIRWVNLHTIICIIPVLKDTSDLRSDVVKQVFKQKWTLYFY
jgi:hypothetical protein